MFGKKSKTRRGFHIIRFKDDYGVKCNMQISSTYEKHIWLGTESPNPKILEPGLGWTPYQMPENTLIDHRMHLTRIQSAKLALKLLKFAILGHL